jgi:predicted RNase H-like nuclease (RuvC/YqgF family)
MSIIEDIKLLKAHYQNKLNWYHAGIDRLESDIQIMWNEYFLKSRSSLTQIHLQELEKNFSILRTAIEYFKQRIESLEKRLAELEKQEYAIINKGEGPVN